MPVYKVEGNVVHIYGRLSVEALNMFKEAGYIIAFHC